MPPLGQQVLAIIVPVTAQRAFTRGSGPPQGTSGGQPHAQVTAGLVARSSGHRSCVHYCSLATWVPAKQQVKAHVRVFTRDRSTVARQA